MLTQNQQGIIFMLLSVICFSTMDILVKFLSASYPTFQLVLFRGVFGLIPIFFIIPKNRYKNLFYTSYYNTAYLYGDGCEYDNIGFAGGTQNNKFYGSNCTKYNIIY